MRVCCASFLVQIHQSFSLQDTFHRREVRCISSPLQSNSPKNHFPRLDVTTTNIHSHSAFLQPIEHTANAHAQPMLQLPSHHRVNEARSLGSFRRRDLRHLLTARLLNPRRRRLSAVIDAPVVHVDILVKNPESFVDHQRRECASQFREHSAQLSNDGRVGVVPRVQQADCLVVLCGPCFRQWRQVQKAVVEDGGGVEDARALG